MDIVGDYVFMAERNSAIRVELLMFYLSATIQWWNFKMLLAFCGTGGTFCFEELVESWSFYPTTTNIKILNNFVFFVSRLPLYCALAQHTRVWQSVAIQLKLKLYTL